MLHHQTLLSSSSSASSESFPFFHLTYSPSSQVGKERRLMEFSLASSASCVNDYDDDSVSLAAENNDVVSIDEYLADEYFLDIGADDDEEDETHQQEIIEKEGEGKENVGFGEGENPSKSPLALSFEAPTLSELSLPTHEVEELEWFSMIMDDSLSEIPKIYENHNIPPKIKVDDEVHNQSRRLPPLFAPTKAKRSKRACNLSASWSSSSSSSSSSTTTTTSSASSSFSFPQLILNHRLFEEIPHSVSKPPPPPPPPKKRGRKPKTAAGGSQTEIRRLVSHGERRCSHCGVNKTPQWRAGPHGAKTLCNACGVRYKSGRLLPEYRPACSPTFVSHVHSNSHRKVLEMRRKKEEREGDKLLLVCSAPPVASF